MEAKVDVFPARGKTRAPERAAGPRYLYQGQHYSVFFDEAKDLTHLAIKEKGDDAQAGVRAWGPERAVNPRIFSRKQQYTLFLH